MDKRSPDRTCVALAGRAADPRVAEAMHVLASHLIAQGCDVKLAMDDGLTLAGLDGVRTVPEADLALESDLVVAVGGDGKIVAGWPVTLTRAGAGFWSTAVTANGTVYAQAVEPEAGGATSTTILAIAPDSTVRSRTTVLEP